jgi:hypothetical protein
MERGCFIVKKINDEKIRIKKKIFCRIKSENSLFKILILGINEK